MGHPVVVPSFLSDLEGLTPILALKLLKEFTEEQLKEAVVKLKASGHTVENAFGWLRSCITQGYERTETKEDRIEKGKRIIRDSFTGLEGKVIGGRSVYVYPDRIEFLSGGVSNISHIIHCSELDFDNKVRKYVQELREGC